MVHTTDRISKSLEEEQIMLSDTEDDKVKSILNTVYQKSLLNFDNSKDLITAAKDILKRPVIYDSTKNSRKDKKSKDKNQNEQTKYKNLVNDKLESINNNIG